MKNKKGLSDVVTIVLIILLALAAVGIIWAFIKPTIENTGGGIDLSAQCFNTEVKPTKCTTTDTDSDGNIDSAIVTVQLAKGKADEVIAILELDDGTTQVQTVTAPTLLGTAQITFDLAAITGNPTKANAAAIISDDNGNTKTCDVSPTVAQCAPAP